MKKLLLVVLSILSMSTAVHAETGPSLQTTFTLTHIAADKWRADYVFPEPVAAIDLGTKVGDYRRQSWKVLTPGVQLVEQADQEAISGGGKPFSALSIEVTLFLPYAEGHYTPFDRMSDGGTAVFVGYFAGDAVQGGLTRPLHLKPALKGWGRETVIAPDDQHPDQLSYAYFGPAEPVPAGAAQLILDPRTPDWLAQLLQDTTAKVTAVYAREFRRPLPYKPLVVVSIGDLETRGLSTKGGAIGRQIVYRLGGKALMGGSPQVRSRLTALVAHELAHVWQNNVARGGIGGNEAWVHEGGAEAISLAGLRGSGLISDADAEATASRLIQECNALNGSVESYRGFYACGFKRYADYRTDIFALWRSMMDVTESTGAVYSGAMIEAILRDGDLHDKRNGTRVQ